MSGASSRRGSGVRAAIDRLAALFPYGALQADTDPAGFLTNVAREIESLRASRGAPGPLPKDVADAIHAFADTHRAAEALGEHASIRQDRAAIVACDEAYCALVEAIQRALVVPVSASAPPTHEGGEK